MQAIFGTFVVPPVKDLPCTYLKVLILLLAAPLKYSPRLHLRLP